MARYIFCGWQCPDSFVRAANNAFKNQRRFNRNTSVLFTMCFVYAAVNEIEKRYIRNELNALKKEIKELKNMEGD